ncbi:MAG: hypothetical protein JJU10_05610 [Idiomarina sp.]|nr:hypothetical protein [Idiomarina sp.]
MTIISPQQLTREFSGSFLTRNDVATNKRPDLIAYTGILMHAFRVYVVTCTVKKPNAMDCGLGQAQASIKQLMRCNAVHWEISVFAKYATTAFTTNPTTQQHAEYLN